MAKNTYLIFDLCWCGKCNQIVYGGKRYINGHNSLNKTTSDLQKKIISEMNKQRIGINNPNYGLKLTEEHIEAFHKNLKGNTYTLGKKQSEEHINKRTENRIKNYPFHSEETKNKISKNHADSSGENNPNWRGGLSFGEYSSEFNNELKQQIKERDNYICKYPGCLCNQLESLSIYGQNLQIHHIDYNKQNCDESNLITLCTKHNGAANGNRKEYEEYFKKFITFGSS